MNFSLSNHFNELTCPINSFTEEFSFPIQASSMIFVVVLISTLALLLLHIIPDSSEKIERLKPHAHLISNIDPKITDFFNKLLGLHQFNTLKEESALYGYIEVNLRENGIRTFLSPNENGTSLEAIDTYFKEIAPILARYFAATALHDKLATGSFDRMLIGITLVTYRTQIFGYHQDKRIAQAAKKIADLTFPSNQHLKSDPKDDAILFLYKPSKIGTILPTISLHNEGLPKDALPGSNKNPLYTKESISQSSIDKYRDRFAFPVITSDREALVIDNTKAFHATPTKNVVSQLYGQDSTSNFFNDNGSLNTQTSETPFLHMSAVVFASGIEPDNLID